MGPYTETESPRSLVTFRNVCFITTNRLLPLILPNTELDHFRPMFGFYIPWKHKPLRFRVSSGGIRKEHWCEMIQFDNSSQLLVLCSAGIRDLMIEWFLCFI